MHHGCVGPLEAFVGGAQVSVGVELEDGHAGEADTAGLHCAQRRRVIPAQDDREPTVLQAALGEGADLAADSVAQEIHPSDRRSVARRRAASLDDRCRELTGLQVPVSDPRGQGSHPDPALVGLVEVKVKEIDLTAGGEDGLGGVAGARAVGGGRLEGHAEHVDVRLRRSVGQAEEAAIGRRGGVGVEVHGTILTDLAEKRPCGGFLRAEPPEEISGAV